MKSSVLLFVLAVSLFFSNLQAQSLPLGQKRWSATNTLNADDYKIEVGINTNELIYSQFLITHQVMGFDFIKKNLNKKIENIFVGKASWVDTTRVSSLSASIAYQQLQFDLCEVYARRFRKQLFINKKKLLKGLDFVKELNNKMIAGFSEERALLVQETKDGSDKEQLTVWEEKIRNYLSTLKQFDYANDAKIKL
ncbi:hypothetical protein [Aquimarina agarilytica]|uniref:hypothetical protein n=1 Tax=Aquimarina agarilytica TaxID=1087449 RepID=UPI000287B014|nr:hypothetical protein [Aquimarina agarilytica]